MIEGSRLKKVSCDLEAPKQNVASLKSTIGEKNVVPSKLKIDESSNPCGLKLPMVVVCNSNDEIPLNTRILIEECWVRLF